MAEDAIALADRMAIMLARPRDIFKLRLDKEFDELHRRIWSVLKDEVLKGYAQSARA